MPQRHAAPSRSRASAKQDEKPANGLPAPRTQGLPSEEKQKRILENLPKRSLNIYENKGTLWKTWERSWNVLENK
jgi:hypothetical protein